MDKNLQQIGHDQLLRVRAEQISLLYKNIPVSSVLVVINALLLMIVQWDVAEHSHLLVWFTFLVVVTILRFLLYIAYRFYQPDFIESERWGKIFLGGVIVAASGWGAMSIWLLPEDIVHQSFLAFVLAGMCAGAVSSLSFMRWPIVSFLVITLSPLIIQLFKSEEFIIVVMGGMLALFLLGLIVTSKNIYNSTLENIMLRMKSVRQNKVLEEAYQHLEQSRQEAEAANRAKSDFLSSMSHELRTPMNAILGFTQLLQMSDVLDEMQHDNVNEIAVAGNHLLELINEVLDLSKIESGYVNLHIEPVDVGSVMGECLHSLKPLSDKRGINIVLICNNKKLSLDEICQEKLMIRADRTRLKQVILNLLSNAVKYNRDNGEVIVSSLILNQDYIRINIQDTGPGLSKEKQAQLFTVFNRLGAESSEVEGTGIGLFITKKLVVMMGGVVGVESSEGEGSSFWVDLPQTKMACKNNGLSGMEENELLDNNVSKNKKYTVLYIEDNSANLRLVTQSLELQNNIIVQSASEPVLGLKLAEECKPELILLDINLPGMDGFEILKQLRQSHVTRNTPVIAISANAMQSDIRKIFEAGFDDCIIKPIDVKELLLVVDAKLMSEK